jgi:hypothetical protein
MPQNLFTTITDYFQTPKGCKFIGYSETGYPRIKCENVHETAQEVSTQTSNNGSPFSDFSGAVITLNDPPLSQGQKNENEILNKNLILYLSLAGVGVFLYTILTD